MIWTYSKNFVAIPITSVKAERDFSCLKGVKINLRNMIFQDQLSVLMSIVVLSENYSQSWWILVNKYNYNINKAILYLYILSYIHWLIDHDPFLYNCITSPRVHHPPLPSSIYPVNVNWSREKDEMANSPGWFWMFHFQRFSFIQRGSKNQLQTLIQRFMWNTQKKSVFHIGCRSKHNNCLFS